MKLKGEKSNAMSQQARIEELERELELRKFVSKNVVFFEVKSSLN